MMIGLALGQESILYLIIFFCAFMGLQAFLSLGKQAAIEVKAANGRIKMMDADGATQGSVLEQMRKDRGIRDDANFASKLTYKINQMVVQSGLKIGAFGIYKYMSGAAIVAGPLLYIAKQSAAWGVIGIQLPEALDVIIRSLGAGHPVPVAMALVAKEMPDPIGSEFGIVSDEISFGSQMTSAIQRLAERTGHPDFELFSAIVRLQERTGGNLVQLLRANAGTIRARQKMRLKIRAASAEGRASAMILNIAPIAVFLLVNFLSPDFYGNVSDNPIVPKTFIGVTVWMIVGNIFMRKMINFKI